MWSDVADDVARHLADRPAEMLFLTGIFASVNIVPQGAQASRKCQHGRMGMAEWAWQNGLYRGGMTVLAGHSQSSPSGGRGDDGAVSRSTVDDTPLTDALLDQFSVDYLVAVLAVRALEEARRQRALAEPG